VVHEDLEIDEIFELKAGLGKEVKYEINNIRRSSK